MTIQGLSLAFLVFIGAVNIIIAFGRLFARVSTQRTFDTYLTNIPNEALQEEMRSVWKNPFTKSKVVAGFLVSALYTASLYVVATN